MQKTILTHQVAFLAKREGVKKVEIFPAEEGSGYAVTIDGERLATFRQEPRVFKKLDAVFSWMREVGIETATICTKEKPHS